MRRLILTAALLVSFAAPARALSIDLSDSTITVTTGFTGANLTVFGTQDKAGQVVIVVEGPSKTIVVRKKSSVGGLWTNTDSRSFKNVPMFYEVAASSPLDAIAPVEVLKEQHIGADNLGIVATRHAGEPETQDFKDALYQAQQDKKLFVHDLVPLNYPGPNLFKARFTLPALVTPGPYKANAYLFSDGKIIEQSSVPFIVVPEGLSADLRRFATYYGLLYGLAGIFMAVVAGWLATVLLKRD